MTDFALKAEWASPLHKVAGLAYRLVYGDRFILDSKSYLNTLKKGQV